jgi:hypothetical protein
MNSDIILQILLFLSFFGIVCFVLKKSPELTKLPENDCFLSIRNFLNNKKDQIQNYWKKRSDLLEKSIHKILFKTRIVFLKADNKTLDLIKKLKQRSEKRKGVDEYWKDIKTSINKKTSSKNRPA